MSTFPKSIIWVCILFFACSTCKAGINVDFDNDGKADIFALNSLGEVYWYESSGVGYSIIDVLEVPVVGVASAMLIEDLDSDGNMDILIGRTGTSNVWYECDGNNSLRFVGYIGNDAVNGGFAVSDIDGDGNNDVFVLSTDEKVVWYECNGNDALLWRSNPMNAGSGATSILIDDFDRNGIEDIVTIKEGVLVRYETDGYSFSWKENFNYLPEGYIVECKDANIGNLDGDTGKDLILIDSVTASIYWYEGQGVSSLWHLKRIDAYSGWGSNINSVAFVDIDGNGSNEIIFSVSDNYIQMYEVSGDNDLAKGAISLFGYGSRTVVGVPEVSCDENLPSLKNVLQLPCLGKENSVYSDLNNDCYVDLIDFSIFADDWLK
ncbi:MAG: FG-GAP repeat domain-containing protein [Sedimentisphaeraceae bacterium JB056]